MQEVVFRFTIKIASCIIIGYLFNDLLNKPKRSSKIKVNLILFHKDKIILLIFLNVS